MFDLITGELEHAPRHQAAPIVASVVAHAVLAGAIFTATVFLVSEQPPEVRTMMAFVAAPPAPLPPPPPAPVAHKAPARREPAKPKPMPTPSPATPTEMPIEIAPEPTAPDFDEEGELAGVEGGVPGGMIGGVVGSLDIEISPPPPPPPPPQPRAPVRVGGEVEAPALLRRVEPIYPRLAAAAGVEGTVILEAIVDREGSVESLRVLRSQRVFDRAALDAVRQWRYAPVLLNGRPEKFVLTVVVTFKLDNG